MNPCPSCDSLADCSTCLPRLAWEGAHAESDPAPCLTCEEVRWLTEAGEMPDRIAARLRMAPRSLDRHLRRHDLLHLIPRSS